METEDSIMAALGFSDAEWDDLTDKAREKIARLSEDRAELLTAAAWAVDVLDGVRAPYRAGEVAPFLAALRAAIAKARGQA